MDKQLEQEWKGRLTEQDFYRILEYAKNNRFQIKEVNQVNHYFDTETLELMNNGAMLRIREKKQTFEATCKFAKEVESARRDSVTPSITDEFTITLSKEEADDYISGNKLWGSDNALYVLLSKAVNQEVTLTYLGKLATQRFLIDLRNGLEPLCLDRSTYLGIIDYELEWETDELEKAHTLLKSLEESLGVKLDWNVMPKSARFFAASMTSE